MQLAPGFSYAAIPAGIKAGDKLDMALIYAPQGAYGAAAFTTSQVKAAPVLLSQKHLELSGGNLSAILVNSGNANACTGAAGEELARNSARWLSDALGIAPVETLIASTGVIGVPLNPKLIEAGIARLSSSLSTSEEAFAAVSEAIMTTDIVAKRKSFSREIGGSTLSFSGISKGSGMISPRMATFLGFIMTDAPISSATAKIALDAIGFSSFNALTVDGDTSTNDTFVIMASKEQAHNTELAAKLNDPSSSEHKALLEAFYELALYLSEAVARDGEGATKLLRVVVTGAANSDDAKKIAFTIAESPLVKTAIFGADANWGRVAAAAGRAGVDFDSSKLGVEFASILTCHNGQAVAFSEEEALLALSQDEVDIHVILGEREAKPDDFASAFSLRPNEGVAGVMTCDFSYDYVRINGEYRS